MINPLTLKDKSFPNNLIQGPLAGVSCAPFRALTWKHSQPAFSCTEMISCKTIIHQPKLAQRRYVEKDKNEGPVCFQLSGNNPIELAHAVKIVTDYGADLIDLNCGCPVKKIRSKGAGSSLLTNPSQLFQRIHAMKQNTHLPVSIKIRVQGNSNEKFNAEVASVIEDAGADFVVVHGRHWTDDYAIPCRYDEIRFFAENMRIPVIGNGDIACTQSYKAMLSTGCAGVMISRSGVGQPWLIKKLITEASGQLFTPPSSKEIGGMFIEHVSGLIGLLEKEKFAILQARKFAKYYARSLKNRMEFSSAINNVESFEQLIRICNDYFNS